MLSLMVQISPQGVTEGQPSSCWLQDPGCMACLPSGCLLMVSGGDGARVLQWPPQTSGSIEARAPGVTQTMTLVPELTSAFTTSRSRMCQKQASLPSPSQCRRLLPGMLMCSSCARLLCQACLCADPIQSVDALCGTLKLQAGSDCRCWGSQSASPSPACPFQARCTCCMAPE